MIVKIKEEGSLIFKMWFQLVGVVIPVGRVAVSGPDAVPVAGTPVILFGQGDLADILLLIFSFGQWNGKAKRAVDAGDMAAVTIRRFDEIFVLFEEDGWVRDELGPVLEAGKVLKVEEDGVGQRIIFLREFFNFFE